MLYLETRSDGNVRFEKIGRDVWLPLALAVSLLQVCTPPALAATTDSYKVADAVHQFCKNWILWLLQAHAPVQQNSTRVTSAGSSLQRVSGDLRASCHVQGKPERSGDIRGMLKNTGSRAWSGVPKLHMWWCHRKSSMDSIVGAAAQTVIVQDVRKHCSKFEPLPEQTVPGCRSRRRSRGNKVDRRDLRQADNPAVHEPVHYQQKTWHDFLHAISRIVAPDDAEAVSMLSDLQAEDLNSQQSLQLSVAAAIPPKARDLPPSTIRATSVLGPQRASIKDRMLPDTAVSARVVANESHSAWRHEKENLQPGPSRDRGQTFCVEPPHGTSQTGWKSNGILRSHKLNSQFCQGLWWFALTSLHHL